jgi:hypothetical protein
MEPYTQNKLSDRTFIREFSPDVDLSELVWHRDLNHRIVTIIEGSGWKIQFDNELPQDLIPGKIIHIPKMVFHRIWKGSDPLKIEIREHE